MSRKLSNSEARLAFEEIVRGIAKQHLRLTFKKRFGNPETDIVNDSLLVKGGVVAPLDKPINHLLHEIPPAVKVTRLLGSAESLAGTQFDAETGLTLGEVLATDAQSQVLIVLGRKARLLVHYFPGDETALVARQVVELAPEPKKLRPAAKKPKAATNSRFRGRR